MITHFEDKNQKSKMKYIKRKMLTTMLKSFDTFVIIATTSNFFKLSLTRIGLTVIPISTGILCGLTISNKVIKDMFIQKYNKYKKQCENDQQTIKSCYKLYRKS